MTRVIVGMGSNIEPRRNIEEALRRLRQTHHVAAQSQVIQTKPIGFAGQPDFLNAAVLIETTLSREELKQRLRQLEASLGRVRGGDKSGPRTIDLDILVWDGQIVDADVAQRPFLQKLIRQVMPDAAF